MTLSTSNVNAIDKTKEKSSPPKRTVTGHKEGDPGPLKTIANAGTLRRIDRQTKTSILKANVTQEDGPENSTLNKDAPGKSFDCEYTYIQHLYPSDIILHISHVPNLRPSSNKRLNQLIVEQRPVYQRLDWDAETKSLMVKQIIAQVESSATRWVYPVKTGQWRLADDEEVNRHVHESLLVQNKGFTSSTVVAKKRKAPTSISKKEKKMKERAPCPIPMNGGMGYPFPPPPFMRPGFPFMFPHMLPPFGMYRPPPMPYGPPPSNTIASNKEKSSKQPTNVFPYHPPPFGMYPPGPYPQVPCTRPYSQVMQQSLNSGDSSVMDNADIIVDLVWSDVICDGGASHEISCLRKADWHVRSIIMPLLTEYMQATDKWDVIQSVIAEIHKVGGRFLKLLPSNRSGGGPRWRLAKAPEQVQHVQREFDGMVIESAGADQKWKEKYERKIREELPWLYEEMTDTQALTTVTEPASKLESSDSTSDITEVGIDDTLSKSHTDVRDEEKTDAIEIYDIVCENDDDDNNNSNQSAPSLEPQSPPLQTQSPSVQPHASNPHDYGMSRQLELTMRSLMERNPECRDLYFSFYDYDLFAPLGHSQDFLWLSENGYSTGEEGKSSKSRQFVSGGQ